MMRSSDVRIAEKQADSVGSMPMRPLCAPNAPIDIEKPRSEASCNPLGRK